MKYAVFALALIAGPSVAHELSEEIADCGCSSACFTDEVSNVGCSGGELRFSARGFPDASHSMMTGITRTNQQFPITHNYTFRIRQNPRFTGSATPTVPGAVGVAVNGIPIFDPGTQGPLDASTGKPPNTYYEGELDACGGHAGRGDDYHYHIAPVCLIEELGRQAIEVNKQPIGFAADGFPILALGWFDSLASLEGKLDECRGARDASGDYFYNVSASEPYEVLDCYNGEVRGFSQDRWDQRKNADGADIVGIPIGFAISEYARGKVGDDICHRMTGTLTSAQVQGVGRVKNVAGSIFHCSSSCYGQFIEVEGSRPKALIYERVLSGCASGIRALNGNTFLNYPAQ